MDVRDFLDWLGVAGTYAGALTLFIMAMVQGAGKLYKTVQDKTTKEGV